MIQRPRRLFAMLVLCGALPACAPPPVVDLQVPSRADIARLDPSLARTEFGRLTRQAVLEHPAMRAGAARIDASVASVSAARAAARPQLVIGANLGANVLDWGSLNRAAPVVQITQLLFDAGATRHRVRAAEASALRETIDRENAAAALALSSAEAWAEVQFRRFLLHEASDNLVTHERFLEQVETRQQGGAGTEADVFSARSRTADALTGRITAQGDLDRAEARFAELYGHAAGDLPELPTAPDLPGATDAEILAASPRLRSLAAELASARASAEGARATRFPGIGLQLDAGYDLRAERADMGVSVQPRLELGAGSQRSALIARSDARVAELEAERTDLERQILRSLAYLRSDQRSGRARVAAATTAVAANEVALGAIEEQFTVGRRTILQVLDARRDLSDAKQALALARRDAALSGYAALALTGDVLDVLGILLPVRAEMSGLAQ